MDQNETQHFLKTRTVTYKQSKTFQSHFITAVVCVVHLPYFTFKQVDGVVIPIITKKILKYGNKYLLSRVQYTILHESRTQGSPLGAPFVHQAILW